MKNDYVFKTENGRLKFVGDFDKLYDDDLNPWGQDGSRSDMASYYQTTRENLRNIVSRYKGSLAEIGCGLGFSLYHITDTAKRKATGYDISLSAIKQARRIFPMLKFEVLDITTNVVKSDIIIINEMLWYVLEKFEKCLDNCKCKTLIINQSFLKTQKYGKDIVDGFDGLVKYLPKHGWKITYAEYNPNLGRLKNGVVICTRQNT